MAFIQCLESENSATKSLSSKFSIESLYKGQGITIGNALRRTLLSDISGIAIVGVRISNVNHEFSIIPGVKEDVIEIFLNLKQLIFKGKIVEPSTFRLNFQGPGIITAGDIKLMAGLKFVDPQQYIATVNTPNTVEIEFFVQQGKGYSLSDTVKSLPQGFLPVDAIFMPVRKVNFFVEAAKNESLMEVEDLILEVQTDGSITPLHAINEATHILKDTLNSISLESLTPQNLVLEETLIKEKPVSFKDALVEELELSVRAYNCLKRANIHTIGELLTYSQEELLEFKNFGQKSANEVCENLKKRFSVSIKLKRELQSPMNDSTNNIIPT